MTSAIDSEIVAARAHQAKSNEPFDVTKLPPAEGRRRANAAATCFNDGGPPMAETKDMTIAGGDGQPMRVRIYRPKPRISDASAPAILYIHGGGWFACDVDTHDRMLRQLALDSGIDVVGIDYRLSPEHPYPAALDDTRAAWRWLSSSGADEGIDIDRVAVAGDSAGANLALALAIDRRDEHDHTPRALALLYGCFAPRLETDSMARYGSGAYGLTAERMGWYWSNYLGDLDSDAPSLAAPLNARLEGLPPVYLGIAEFDVVADDSRLLAGRLRQAGVSTTLSVWPCTTHGMLQMTRDVAAARAAMREIAEALTARLAAT